MCHPASFVLTKDNVFWSKKTDSHEEIIEEFKLVQDGIRGPNILRVEISPTTHRQYSCLRHPLLQPIDTWQFKVDQDIMPEWYDSTADEARTREALVAWYAARVVLSGTTRELQDTWAWVFGNAHVAVRGRSGVWAYDRATVQASDKTEVTAYDLARVAAYDNSVVRCHDATQCTACGSVSVIACDRTAVQAFGDSKIDARGNCQVDAFERSNVIASGDTHIDARGEAKLALFMRAVARVCESAQVVTCCDDAIVVYNNTQKVIPSGRAMLIEAKR